MDGAVLPVGEGSTADITVPALSVKAHARWISEVQFLDPAPALGRKACSLLLIGLHSGQGNSIGSSCLCWLCVCVEGGVIDFSQPPPLSTSTSQGPCILSSADDKTLVLSALLGTRGETF